ncbi:MAG TPA: ABC transporter ATP-binding protein [Desulfobacteraceae bacterium]|nr:ABC transporter ATP-binding protein [Desulfobacteraceae bacterium]HPJ68147.1 ABC transporter ATP-binding protein [Desulfobacteraceae bacterium]HPQ28939.1 ABC transporter ATP-binding protein [Desulfobacteraceae bacterium]
MLDVKGIHTFYGLSHILFDVSLKINAGEVVCLLGRNGAGKSTTIKSIMGIAPPKQGRIIFKGEDVAGKKPFMLARKGMGYDPDDRRIFADLTVEENLEIAIKGYVEGEGWNKERVYDFFPALKDIRHRRGGVLSGGEQKMLAIARALMGNPELLLLDEPTEGLAPVMVRVLEEQLMKLKKTGLTVLLAEQNLVSTLKLSDRGYIIDNGRIRYEGTVQELRDNEEIQKQCLMV